MRAGAIARHHPKRIERHNAKGPRAQESQGSSKTNANPSELSKRILIPGDEGDLGDHQRMLAYGPQRYRKEPLKANGFA